MKKITVAPIKFDPDFSFANPHPVLVYKNPTGRIRGNLQIKATFGELNGLVVNKETVYVWAKDLATHDDVKKQFTGSDYIFELFKINAFEQVKAVGTDVTAEQLMAYPAVKVMMKF